MEKEKVYIKNILRHVPGSVYWKDRNGVYLGCNQMEADMVGLKSPELIIGKTDYDLSWKCIADVLRKTDQRIMETRISEEVIETPTLADGKTVIMLTKKSPLYDDDENVIGIIGVSMDVTDRKKIEQLEAQNKLKEEVKILAEQVAHDIRSPLIVLGKLAENCPTLPEKEHVILRNAVTSIETIAEDLLDRYAEADEEAKKLNR